MPRILSASLVVLLCACEGSSSSGSGSPPSGPSSAAATSATTSASAAAPPPPATGPVLPSPLPAGIAEGSTSTSTAVRVQVISTSSRWMVLGGPVIHLCEWKPGASFKCDRVEQKLPYEEPLPTVTLTADPPYLIVDETTYDKRGTFDPKGAQVSPFYERTATRFPDGSLAIDNADMLVRYATPGKSPKTSPFIYPREYAEVEQVADSLIYLRTEGGKRTLFTRTLEGPTEPPAEEQRIGDIGDIERTGFVHGCISPDERLVLVSETLKDYSLGRAVFLERQGDRWSAPVVLGQKLPTYLDGARIACGRGAIAWADVHREAVHHLRCAKGACKMGSIEGLVAKDSFNASAAPIGDELAVISAEKDPSGERKYRLRLAPPDALATAPARDVIAWGKGGADKVTLVGGADVALLLVRLSDTGRWLPYELDATGAVKPLGQGG